MLLHLEKNSGLPQHPRYSTTTSLYNNSYFSHDGIHSFTRSKVAHEDVCSFSDRWIQV